MNLAAKIKMSELKLVRKVKQNLMMEIENGPCSIRLSTLKHCLIYWSLITINSIKL
jgi:hypothetical protein